MRGDNKRYDQAKRYYVHSHLIERKSPTIDCSQNALSGLNAHITALGTFVDSIEQN